MNSVAEPDRFSPAPGFFTGSGSSSYKKYSRLLTILNFFSSHPTFQVFVFNKPLFNVGTTKRIALRIFSVSIKVEPESGAGPSHWLRPKCPGFDQLRLRNTVCESVTLVADAYRYPF